MINAVREVTACERCLDAQVKGRVGRNEDKKFPRGAHPQYDKACVWCAFCDDCLRLVLAHCGKMAKVVAERQMRDRATMDPDADDVVAAICRAFGVKS